MLDDGRNLKQSTYENMVIHAFLNFKVQRQMRTRSRLKQVNDYLGGYLSVWFPTGVLTRTDTIPIWLQLVKEDGVTPLGDVAGHKIVLSFASELSCLDTGQLLLEVEIHPQAPTTDAIFNGVISDDQTFGLPVGSVYVSVAHIDAAGAKYILDMAKIVVAPCLSTRRA